jgi:hypothetical protein
MRRPSLAVSPAQEEHPAGRPSDAEPRQSSAASHPPDAATSSQGLPAVVPADISLVFSRASFLDSIEWLAAENDFYAEKSRDDHLLGLISIVCDALAEAEQVVLNALAEADKFGKRISAATLDDAIQRLTTQTCLSCSADEEQKVISLFLSHLGDGEEEESTGKKEHESLQSNTFAAFMIGDSLLRKGKSKRLAARLIRLSLERPRFGGSISTASSSPHDDGGRFSGLPRAGVARFYFSAALLNMASLFEDGILVGGVRSIVQGTSKQLLLSAEDAIIHALELTRGDNRRAWQSLASAEQEVVVFGRTFSPAEAAAQAIRCAGGAEGYADAGMWLDLALNLPYDLSSGEKTATVAVPSAGHVPFSLIAGLPASQHVIVDRKVCLARSLALIGENAFAWVELSKCLSVGNMVEDGCPSPDGTVKRLVHREEKVQVGGVGYGRVDCLSLAIALEPDFAEAWFRAALCMEEKHKCLASAARDGVLVDKEVYERRILKDFVGDRVSCLIRAVQCDGNDAKIWFALAATLSDREDALSTVADLEPLMVPTTLLGKASERIGEDQTEPITSDKCFAAAIAIDPRLASVVDKWRRSQR